jgi:hypothetical protein
MGAKYLDYDTSEDEDELLGATAAKPPKVRRRPIWDQKSSGWLLVDHSYPVKSTTVTGMVTDNELHVLALAKPPHARELDLSPTLLCNYLEESNKVVRCYLKKKTDSAHGVDPSPVEIPQEVEYVAPREPDCCRFLGKRCEECNINHDKSPEKKKKEREWVNDSPPPSDFDLY